MTSPNRNALWGTPPWHIDFVPAPQTLSASFDFAIVGAGFTGLSAAAWLKLLDPQKSVAVFDAAGIGDGASGRTGGMVLAESAAGDLPGLGDVLAGFTSLISKLGIDCDLSSPGAWEVARSGGEKHSPIDWNDSGSLRVVAEVPGGTLDPGKHVSGLARAAQGRGVIIFAHTAVTEVEWSGQKLRLASGETVSAGKILFATNGLSLALSGLTHGAHPKLTLAARTAPLPSRQIEDIGLALGKPFYTVDFPYLWGRTCRDRSIIWGAGLVDPAELQELESVDISQPGPQRMFSSLEQRIHNLHPALASAKFTHCWGGPILFREAWRPVFSIHPQSHNAIVLGAYAGHGVALSSYLGVWAAEVMLGRRELPKWGAISR